MTTTAPTIAYTPAASRPDSMSRVNRVVVGVDDDPASMAALRFAAREASYRGVDVAAVHVWHFPQTWGWAYESSLGPQMLIRLQDMVSDVIAERVAAGEPAVAMSAEVIEGEPAVLLREAADGAVLLVVGARHHNRLLGSVSQSCTSHPTCPVVVVPMQAG